MLQRAAANRCDSGEPGVRHPTANGPTAIGGIASVALTKPLKCICSDSLLDKTTRGILPPMLPVPMSTMHGQQCRGVPNSWGLKLTKGKMATRIVLILVSAGAPFIARSVVDGIFNAGGRFSRFGQLYPVSNWKINGSRPQFAVGPFPG